MIHVEFKNFEEMVAFARELLKGREEKPVENQTTVPATSQATPAQTPVSAPMQNVPPTYAVPTAPAAPVAQQLPTVPVAIQAAPTANAVPTSTPSYTLDDLARAAMTLMDSGRQAELMQLLAQFGVEMLPALPQSQYGAFATALRGLGAQI